MRIRRLVLILSLVPATTLAWGKKKEAAKPALTPLKAGVHHQCLTPLAEKKDPAGLIGMGILDQVKGDLGKAEERYRAAFAAGYDVLAAPVDLTLDKGVVWIQTEACPVPLPAPPEAETIEIGKVSKGALEPTYPRVLLSVRSEGVVQTTVWLGADGKPERVHVDSTSAGPAGIERRREAGEEVAERLVARVQFALQSLEDLRAHDFGKDKAGKRFAWKLSYVPPLDYTENLPGTGPNTAGEAVKKIGGGTKGGGLPPGP